jgi:hypothetical protein
MTNTLEDEINQLLKVTFSKKDISNMSFEEVMDALASAGSRLSSTLDDYLILDAIPKINYLIQKSPLEVCLTSPSDYVRKYRKLYDSGQNIPSGLKEWQEYFMSSRHV